MLYAPIVRVVVVRMLAVKFGDGGLKRQKTAAQLRAFHRAATSGEMQQPAPTRTRILSLAQPLHARQAHVDDAAAVAGHRITAERMSR